MLCTFWLIDCLIGLKRFEGAEILIKRIEGVANHLGLFSEEYDVNWREALGNFPQAFTHIGYINSVIALRQAKGKEAKEDERDKSSPLRKLLLTSTIVLNDGEPSPNMPIENIAMKLKDSMNILRGAFFDTKRGRVSYEQMQR